MPGAFLIQGDGSLVGLEHQPVTVEADFQALLARYPDLLAGDQVDPDAPRRWLLIDREVGVPDAGGDTGDRWSLDHLFLDQDAIPTFVEVKRAGDTRARREVVAQMLDYAANGIAYWTIEQLRASFEAKCTGAGTSGDETLAAFLGADRDLGEFWQAVKTNLQAGRVRLLFVADELPPELRRIIEFLNRQMDPAEVLGVELRHLQGGGVKTIIPRVHGRTEEAQRKKAAGRAQGPEWTAERFRDVLLARGDEAGAQVLSRVLQWSSDRGLRLWWGRGAKEGAVCPTLDVGGQSFWPFYFRTGYRTAYVECAFKTIAAVPFADPAGRRKLIERLNRVPGVAIDLEAVNRYPRIEFASLCNTAALEAFLAAIDWAFDEVKAAAGPGASPSSDSP